MLFLATTHLPDPAAARPHLGQEMQHLRRWRDSAELRSALIRRDGTGAFLVLDAVDLAAAEHLVSQLPLVLAGVMTYQLTTVTDPFA